MFADGRYFTPDGKAHFIPVRTNADVQSAASGFPLALNTGRVRDHWHTMTRTGLSERLSQHCAEPFVEIHPDDAARHHIGDADLVRVSTGLGAILVRALRTPRQQRGSIFVPMHWNDQFASRARIDTLIAGITDPHSGQPASKNVPARIERFVAAKYGFAVLQRRPEVIEAEYWAIARCAGGWRLELALADDKDDWTGFVRALIGGDSDPVVYHDAQTGRTRLACYASGRLIGTLFLAPEPVSVSREWAVSQLIAPIATARNRSTVLAGRAAAGSVDRGTIVCACFGVGAGEIAASVARGCATVGAVGEATCAGTNCGSCRAEIRSIIERHGSSHADSGAPAALVTSG
jgi:assimilatory nitrate reductase catalytic subunit